MIAFHTVTETPAMIIDDARLSPKSNNLTLVRLMLASAVIWTHSIWRVTGVREIDQFKPWLGHPISNFAVDGFFFLSGFLVYASLLRRESVKDFATARFARLWPAMAISVLLTVAIGAFLTTAEGAAYLGGPTGRFVLFNLSMLFPAFNLTGVNCGAALCNINGSLWTIPWEVRCYILLALLGGFGLSRPAVMKCLILPATAAFAVAMHLPGVESALGRIAGSTVVYYLHGADRLWFMFALGIAAFIWRAKLKLSWWWTLGLLLATVVSTRLDLYVPHLAQLLTASFVLNLGFLTAARKVVSGNWPDYSYGMYIYAFPVMMILAALAPGLTATMLAVVTALCTLVPAALSWHLAEKPVLDKVRDRWRQKRTAASPTSGTEGEACKALA